MKYLVTGAAGFIGNFVAERLCEQGHDVVGLDNLNDYYDPNLKLARLKRIEHLSTFRFIKMDISDRIAIARLFEDEKFDRVIHLAAQAGVRYSIENPMAYIDSNMVGMATILEGCRHNKVQHLVYASSSSVYGANKKIPFAESDRVDHPVSLYAATKKSNELMAHTYSHLYSLPTTGLRFFTVYGPWGRPDMAPFLFTDAIANDRPIKVFNNGKMQRDFTYIDDIVEGIIRIQDVIPMPTDKATLDESSEASAFYKLYNIGNNQPVELEQFITCIENALGKKANKQYLPMQDGDVVRTFADVSGLENTIDFKPNTQLQDGINEFVEWYLLFLGDER
ncbi:NAD-dependent epimerase [Shewanella glacialimarina]|uniref:NAD-dependent epimerase n=1 Tax=Shewanella glacialimarina TaxID=2590884 RepID=UPI001CF83B57|nr:NAD-dependent epimerase [Shewanella glacialimarina]UCX04254.1 NAD-dependent epimerase [Shewanella glacialimarina]